MTFAKLQTTIAYGDEYVQSHIVAAVRSQLLEDTYDLVESEAESAADERRSGESSDLRSLHILPYEALNFEHALLWPSSQYLVNAYVIRKALIRKNYLSSTILHYTTKNTSSVLAQHFKPCVDFELDYAEFLDEALLEAYELHESFLRNADQPDNEKEWWILKPSMSDGGRGIRLFSSEDELREIFEEWEADAEESESEDDSSTLIASSEASNAVQEERPDQDTYGIVTSQLRHFTAQPYICNPLLIPEEPFRSRKFHIRTYIVAHGALHVYVYAHMLALFASQPYRPPRETSESLNDMRSIHLTNTCMQTSTILTGTAQFETGVLDSVALLSSLPLPADGIASIRSQIATIVAETFRAALAQPTNFQPIPTAFEVFGVDFLVSDGRCHNSDSAETSSSELAPDDVRVWLLEVNAFPDFAQTGARLADQVVGGLWRCVIQDIVAPHFALSTPSDSPNQDEKLELVFSIDLHK